MRVGQYLTKALRGDNLQALNRQKATFGTSENSQSDLTVGNHPMADLMMENEFVYAIPRLMNVCGYLDLTGLHESHVPVIDASTIQSAWKSETGLNPVIGQSVFETKTVRMHRLSSHFAVTSEFRAALNNQNPANEQRLLNVIGQTLIHTADLSLTSPIPATGSQPGGIMPLSFTASTATTLDELAFELATIIMKASANGNRIVLMGSPDAVILARLVLGRAPSLDSVIEYVPSSTAAKDSIVAFAARSLLFVGDLNYELTESNEATLVFSNDQTPAPLLKDLGDDFTASMQGTTPTDSHHVKNLFQSDMQGWRFDIGLSWLLAGDSDDHVFGLNAFGGSLK